jgi:hypothetical protein
MGSQFQTPAFIDPKHAIAHNKIIIIDPGNTADRKHYFTKAAEKKL